MKRIAVVMLALMLASCAYNYRLGVDEGVPPEGMARIKFSNTIKMAEIDGQPFQPKYSIWVHGSHEVLMNPGVHRFKFRYSDVSLRGGSYTKDYVMLAAELKAGNAYEIKTERDGGRMYFRIEQVE